MAVRGLQAGICVVLAGLAAGAPARAFEEVGQDTTVATAPGGGGAGPCPGSGACTVALLRTRSGADAAIPSDGVLVRVRLRGAPGADDIVTPRVLRPAGDGILRPVAAAAPLTLDGSGTAQSAPARIPVRAGDVLAVRSDALPGSFATASGSGAAAIFSEPPLWAVGDPGRAPGPAVAPGDLLLAATLEADADGDGYGDETQDACPVDAARISACDVDLVASADAPEFAVGGRAVDHRFLVVNRGSSPAAGAVADLDAPVDAQLSAIEAPGACVSRDAGGLRCALGRLEAGGQAEVVVTLVGVAGAVVRTTLQAVGPVPDPTPDDDRAAAATLLTPPSVAPAPRPFADPPCANLVLGTGDDELIVGTGFGDRIVGGAGRDLIRADGGPDCLEGGVGGDVLDAGTGDDRIAAGAGGDRLIGGAGMDVLRGGFGDDALIGGAGDDQLLPGQGRDRVDAGPGNDAVDARDGVAERIDCGRGADVASVDPEDRVRGCERITRR